MSRVKQRTKLDLERIVFIGRTFEEYLSMFSISKEELEGKRILDCPAGACSFTAVGTRQGLDVTACDIAYDHPPETLKKKGLSDIDHAMHHMQQVKGNYNWNYYQTIEKLREHRLSALSECTIHMKETPERYIPVTLPTLLFRDHEFDILLSAHFLFMYADRLDYPFHLKTLNELLRVTKEEVRIFPLVDLEGNRYVHLDKIKKDLSNKGYLVKEVKVAYEFQLNANTMLSIKRMNDKHTTTVE